MAFASPTDSSMFGPALSPALLPFAGALPAAALLSPVQSMSPSVQQQPNSQMLSQVPFTQFSSLLHHLPLQPHSMPRPLPKIHRLIPAQGPIFGGIDVTVLGSGFDSPDLVCIFGGARASMTTKWSDNTLVCTLPPRATPGQVTVTVERREDGAVSEEHDITQGNLFTYTDESDRKLCAVSPCENMF